MIAPDRLVTIDCVEGQRIVERLGRVNGETTVQRGFLRSTFRSIGQFMGITSAEFLTDAERGRTGALETLQAAADALGADAVIGVCFEVIERSEGSTRVRAFGEAVRLGPAESRPA